MFRYCTYEELLPFVGTEVEFYGFGTDIKKGILMKDENKNILWLPFCGLVNATTVKINVL